MVKAPRSKGCRVCVQRRIKCDQTRPFCNRCLRSNRQCTGFQDNRFIDEGPLLRGLYEGPEKAQNVNRGRSPPSLAPSSSPEPDWSYAPFPYATEPSNAKKERSLSPITGDNWVQGAFERGALVSLLAPNVMQDQLFAKFIASVRKPALGDTIPSHRVWLAEVAGRPSLSPALTWAVRAISISHLGRRAGDNTLLETSRRIYGRALLKLNHTLQDTEEGLSSDTLSATILLSFYEVFNCTDSNSWIRHAGGAGRLIQLRGPDRHRSGFDRLIFLACRTSLIMEAFTKRAPCFLEAPQWRKLCWDLHEELHLTASLKRTDEEYFQEIVGYPAYLEKAFTAMGDPDADFGYLQNLRAEGLAHWSRWRTIHADMSEELAEAGNEPIQVASAVDDRVFPVVYNYPDIHIASFYCGYWTASCFLNICIAAFDARLAGYFDAQNPPRQGDLETGLVGPRAEGSLHPKIIPGHLWNAARSIGDTHSFVSENAAYAREICKCVEYMGHATFLGPSFLIFGMRMALRMGISDEEKAWIVRKLRDIGRDMGLAEVELERYKRQREGGYGIEWEQKKSPRGAMIVDRELDEHGPHVSVGYSAP